MCRWARNASHPVKRTKGVAHLLLSPTEVESARRAFEAIEDNRHPSQEDALALRVWAGPRYKMGPLEEIAKNILKAAGETPTQI